MEPYLKYLIFFLASIVCILMITRSSEPLERAKSHKENMSEAAERDGPNNLLDNLPQIESRVRD